MGKFLERQWPILGVGVLLALVTFYLIKAGKEAVQGPLLRAIMPGEGLELRDIRYSHDDPDKGLKWFLDAKEVRLSGDKRSIYFKDFRLRVEPKDKIFLELRGKRGNYSRDSGDINLWGNLEGYSGNGYKIVTEHVIINEKSRKLSSDKSVKISGPFFSVDGQGLSVDLKKERLKMLSDVTAIIDTGPLI